MKRTARTGFERKRLARSGLTLLELLIALALLSIVFSGVLDATQRGLDLFQRNSVQGDLHARCSRATGRIADALRPAVTGTLVPDLAPPAVGPDPGNVGVDFRSAAAWGAAGVVESTWDRITFVRDPEELDNGVDDDGDGLIDEGRVVWTRRLGEADEQSTVLAHGVREFLAGETENGLDDNGNGLVDEAGFCLSRVGDEVRILLSLERSMENEFLVRTQSTSIALRN